MFQQSCAAASAATFMQVWVECNDCLERYVLLMYQYIIAARLSDVSTSLHHLNYGDDVAWSSRVLDKSVLLGTLIVLSRQSLRSVQQRK